MSVSARAAALGLEYPGIYGAPDLSSPAAGLMHSKTFSFDNPAAAEPNTNSYRDIQVVGAPFDPTLYRQVLPRASGGFQLSHDPYLQASRRHLADQMPHFSQGQFFGEPESSMEAVGHIAPPTLAEAPSRPYLATWHPQGHRGLLLSVHNERNPPGEKYAPQKRGLPYAGLSSLLSRIHASYHGGINPERAVPIPRSARLSHRKRKWPGFWKGVRNAGRLARNPHQVLSKALVQSLKKAKMPSK